MKRGLAVLFSVGVVAALGYFTASKWAIHHDSMTFYDADRDNRPVAVDIAVRRDKQMQADAGMLKLPVAVINHGNTVKNTEYSFLANVLAARGYLVMSIQHDLPTDAPMVTKVGEIYVGRLTQIERGGGRRPDPWKTFSRNGSVRAAGAKVYLLRAGIRRRGGGNERIQDQQSCASFSSARTARARARRRRCSRTS